MGSGYRCAVFVWKLCKWVWPCQKSNKKIQVMPVTIGLVTAIGEIVAVTIASFFILNMTFVMSIFCAWAVENGLLIIDKWFQIDPRYRFPSCHCSCHDQLQGKEFGSLEKNSREYFGSLLCWQLVLCHCLHGVVFYHLHWCPDCYHDSTQRRNHCLRNHRRNDSRLASLEIPKIWCPTHPIRKNYSSRSNFHFPYDWNLPYQVFLLWIPCSFDSQCNVCNAMEIR